jgi:hypothetical protein
MEAWWAALNEPLRWFYVIAISTSALLVLQLLAMILGFDGDGDELEAGEVHVLSVRTVTAYFAGFGWTGVAALESGASLPLALILAAAVGGLFMGGVLLLMKALYSMRHSGTLDYKNAIGQVGSVYMRIPPALSDSGQIELRLQGRLTIAQAVTRGPIEIPGRSRVRVVELLDQNTLIVELLEPGGAPPPPPVKEEI